MVNKWLPKRPSQDGSNPWAIDLRKSIPVAVILRDSVNLNEPDSYRPALKEWRPKSELPRIPEAAVQGTSTEQIEHSGD